jgi:chaperonin GroES
MSKNIQPLAGYVLVKELESRSIGSIQLAGSEENADNLAKVLKCGNDKVEELTGRSIFHKCPVKKGDVIVYKKFAYTEVNLDGEKFRLVEFNDIIGIVEE